MQASILMHVPECQNYLELPGIKGAGRSEGDQFIWVTSALTLSEGLVSGVATLPVSRVL